MALSSVETPTLTPEPGTYLNKQTVTIACSTLDVEIHYTIDGSEPTDSSLTYDNFLEVTSNTTIKARAFKEYYPSSEIAQGEYQITTQTVAIPIFNPTPGSYGVAQTVILTCYTAGAEIHYTLDGSLPTMDSPTYTNPLTISSTSTIKAFATMENYISSTITSAQYVINSQVVAKPTFTPDSGYYYEQQPVRIHTSTPGSTLYYTLDGSEPTESSLMYTNTLVVNSNTTIKARGFKNNFLPSEVRVGHYYVSNELTSSPDFDPPAGYYVGEQMVYLTSATPRAMIYYTTDGSEPTEYSDVYIYPLDITSTTTIKACAYETNYFPSEVVEGTFYIGSPIPDNFVLVEGGTFSNGVANITLSTFYMDKYELTQADYTVLMEANPVYHHGTGDNYPVYNVSWQDALMYCNARSIEEDLLPCYDTTEWSCDFSANGYRLPTEMEWMYAAKGGNQQPATGYNEYSGTDLLSELPNYAWYDLYDGNRSYEVGTKLPNQLGLYDMSGNVLELCWDKWDPCYPYYPQIDPTGPIFGENRVARGGAWLATAEYCSVWNRVETSYYLENFYCGFRIVRRLPD